MIDNIYPGQIVRNIRSEQRFKVVAISKDTETWELAVTYHTLDKPYTEFWTMPQVKFDRLFEEVPGGLFG